MPAPAATLSDSPFEIDAAGQRVTLHGRPLNLTRREFGLLADLLRNSGRIRSRDELLNAVWGTDSDSTDRTVDTHIKTLRAKLQEVTRGQDCITTHRGMGYSLDVDRLKGS
jgi:two-component system catabolic regulation response regulator CreB